MDVCSKPQFNKIDFICAKSLFDVAFYITYITKLLYEKSQIHMTKITVKTVFALSGGGAKPLIARVLAYRPKFFGGVHD